MFNKRLSIEIGPKKYCHLKLKIDCFFNHSLIQEINKFHNNIFKSEHFW